MKRRTAILILVLTIALGSGTLYFLLGGKAPNGLPLISGLPFGSPPEDIEPTDTGTTTDSSPDVNLGGQSGTSGVPISAFQRLSDTPVAGAVLFVRSGEPYVRFVERATGHVYETKLSTLEKIKILNVTRPKIYKAVWKSDASGFIERTVGERSDVVINTSVSLIPPATSTDILYSIKSTLLQGEVDEIAILPTNNLLYALMESPGIYSSGFDGERPRVILSSDFYSWLLYPTGNTSSIVATKPSFGADGFAYSLNLNNGSLSKLLGPLKGLTLLPNNDGRRILYSYLDQGRSVLSALNTTTGLDLNIRTETLPEKCVWSRRVSSVLICGAPEGGLGEEVPDLWYQGSISYNDNIWRFNTDTNTAEILLDPKAEFGEEVDIVDLILSPDDKYLVFTNKKDLSLWVFILPL